MAGTRVILKERYYLDHFEEMIRFLEERYKHTFAAEHRAFLSDFGNLSLDARCLYVRLANRKGPVFRKESLAYDEIGDLDPTLSELREAGFTVPAGAEQFHGMLLLQKRPVLADWIRGEGLAGAVPSFSSARKKDLLDFVEAHLPFDRCFSPEDCSRYLVQDRIDEVEYLLFLYFGKLRDSLTSFALRDLGVVQPAEFRSRFEARFSTREEALVSYHYEKTIEAVRQADPSALVRMKEEAGTWPGACNHETTSLRTRAIQKLGRALERLELPGDALDVYRMTREFPASERSVRLLYRLERREEARSALEQMIEDPSCDEELLFAEDFFARKFQSIRVGKLTALLRGARVMKLDESGRGAPEAAVVRELAREGIEAWHTENLIWQQLFGLVFWDLLFGEESAPLHNDFEWRPGGLDSGEFANRHRRAIEDRLRLLDDREKAIGSLVRTWEEHEGTPNGLFPWYSEGFERVRMLVEQAPEESLRGILSEMIQHHRANRSGFPDLLIRDQGILRFAEVKSEGDKLQRHQLARLERLKSLGFPVEVIRVEWTVDPNQEYVVVDVETTGGNPKWNRVTEIGAVKIRGDRILEEWSTLLHPGRRIPKKIVQLTGITDEMVAEAPHFEAIAEEFHDFLGDSVFVAHRASFDYGFIRAEFERAGIDFRAPTLCTVVAMRRFFPGLASYGLAGLCEAFQIPLDTHHRALCDARATAQLLLRINEERVSEDRPQTEIGD